jgi:Alpha-L-arabinofuranosidase B, catalytic
MHRGGFFALFFSSLAGVAFADTVFPLSGVGGGSAPVVYVGPGDVVSGAKAWYGLRAYNAAYATGSNNAITVRRTSDSTTSNIKILTTGALDVASATTFCNATTCFISKFYDQSGASNCSGACDASQATAANQPQLIFNCVNTSLPCARFVGTSSQRLVSPTITNVAQPFTLNFSASRPSTATSSGSVLGSDFNGVQIGFLSTAGTAYVLAPTVQSAAASDNAFHNISGVFTTAGSSTLVVDATTIGSLSPGADFLQDKFSLGDSDGSSNYFTGDFLEAGVWPGALSGANMTSICHNQFVYWATSTSC